MTDWQAFEGAVAPQVRVGSTCPILRLRDDVAKSLQAQGARRVAAEINDHAFNLVLTRAPVTRGRVARAGQRLLDRLGIAPGNRMKVRLRPAPPAAVGMPQDVAVALRQADRTAFGEALSPGKRRGSLYTIGTATTAATRAKRIGALAP